MNKCAASMKTTTTKAKAKSICAASTKTNTTKVKAESSRLPPQLAKTRMCAFHLAGTCNMGSDCRFAHSDEELKPLPDLSRTRFCQVLLQTGRCNTENCTYAHSADELVTDSCHKTKLCRFWQAGQCGNGEKCRFAHSADELKKSARVMGKPQQQDQQYNNSKAITAIFDTSPVQAPYPVTLQPLITNGQEVPIEFRAYEGPMSYDLPRTKKDTCSAYNLVPQQFKDDSFQEGQEWNLPGEMKLTRGASDSTQDSDGFKSWSTFSDGSESEVETTPHIFGPDSYASGAPDFPPIYREGQENLTQASMQQAPVSCPGAFETFHSAQEPFTMNPRSNLEGKRVTPKKLEQLVTKLNKIAFDLQKLRKLVPSTGRMPVTPNRVQQANAVENDTGDIIDHYTGAVEIMQAPLAEETPAPTFDDNDEDIWQAFLGTIDYQVKNTFISVKEETTYYPLRHVRSAAGRLTAIDNHP